jgi:hypothetical protein
MKNRPRLGNIFPQILIIQGDAGIHEFGAY